RNSPRMILHSPVRAVAWTLLLLVASAAPDATPRANAEASHVEPTRTAKERLRGKASDEQRGDKCKEPLAVRGAEPRPDQCGDGASTPVKRLSVPDSPR